MAAAIVIRMLTFGGSPKSSGDRNREASDPQNPGGGNANRQTGEDHAGRLAADQPAHVRAGGARRDAHADFGRTSRHGERHQPVEAGANQASATRPNAAREVASRRSRTSAASTSSASVWTSKMGTSLIDRLDRLAEVSSDRAAVARVRTCRAIREKPVLARRNVWSTSRRRRVTEGGKPRIPDHADNGQGPSAWTPEPWDCITPWLTPRGPLAEIGADERFVDEDRQGVPGRRSSSLKSRPFTTGCPWSRSSAGRR